MAAVNLNGGTLRFKNYIKVVNALGAKFNYTAGTIQLSGDRDLGTDATIPQLFGATPIIHAGKGLTIEGTARLTTVPITLSGGTLAAGTLAVMPGGRLQTTQASQAVGLFVALAGSAIDATGGSLVVGNVSKVNGFYGNGTLLPAPTTVTSPTPTTRCSTPRAGHARQRRQPGHARRRQRPDARLRRQHHRLRHHQHPQNVPSRSSTTATSRATALQSRSRSPATSKASARSTT